MGPPVCKAANGVMLIGYLDSCVSTARHNFLSPSIRSISRSSTCGVTLNHELQVMLSPAGARYSPAEMNLRNVTVQVAMRCDPYQRQRYRLNKTSLAGTLERGFGIKEAVWAVVLSTAGTASRDKGM